MKKYYIESTHEVYIDTYNEGEGKHVNSYTQKAMISAENQREAIQKYFENELYFDFNFQHASIDHEEGLNENINTLHYSNLVDDDNAEASKSEIEAWKRGVVTLYSNSTYLTIFELTEVKI
jgi:hypothetical protein